MNKPEWLILAGYLGLWLIAALLTVPKLYGLTILPDEFGYMAQAAGMAGMDWKAVNAQCSYYSFGYGILIYPFMKLASDGVALYRCMAGINFLLMGLGTILLFKLLTQCFHNVERKLLALISGIAAFYVACITYAQTAMTEVLLTFLYILLAWLMYRWFREPSLKNGCLVILTVGYMYMVHMRTIGILLVTVLCIAARALTGKGRKRNWKQLILFITLFVILLFLTGLIKNRLIQDIGSEIYSRRARTNDYSGQWGKLLRLCSLKGMVQFFTSLTGKVFYLGCASFGLYYWGMFFAIKKGKEWIVNFFRKQEIAAREWLFFWLLLAHVSALFISAVYCLGTGRLDAVLYGRYHENTILCIMALGIVGLLEDFAVKRRLIWLIVLTSTGFFTVYAVLAEGNTVSVARQSITGILYALIRADYYDTKTLLYAYVVSGICSVLVLGLVWLARRGKQWYGFLFGISLLQVVSAFEASRYLTIPTDSKKENVQFIDQTRHLACEKQEEEILYLYQDTSKLLYPVQYLLQDISLHLVSEEELWETGRAVFLIIPKGYEEKRGIPEGYEKIADSPSYELYYNPG